MAQGGIVLLFIVAAIGILYVAWYIRDRRRKAFAALATSLGLQYSPDDPFGLEDLPFALMDQGDGRGCENVLHGTWNQLDLKTFDYWYYERHTNSKGVSSRTYYRFSCAVIPLAFASPHTTIEPETLLTRLADHLGFRDIDFESEEFNRLMQVKSADKRFANYLVDARMMQWLLATRGWQFELSDRYLLCYERKVAPDQYLKLLAALKCFYDQIPRVVYETFGGTR